MRRVDTDEFCYPDVRETVRQALIIKSQGETRRIEIESYAFGYLIYHPLSFSTNGRYLAADVDIAYTGGDPGATIAIFDLVNGELVPLPAVCEHFDFESYVGFISPTEIAVHCTAYGDQIEQFESVDVQSGIVHQLSAQPASLSDYGATAGEIEVTKTQIFQ